MALLAQQVSMHYSIPTAASGVKVQAVVGGASCPSNHELTPQHLLRNCSSSAQLQQRCTTAAVLCNCSSGVCTLIDICQRNTAAAPTRRCCLLSMPAGLRLRPRQRLLQAQLASNSSSSRTHQALLPGSLR